MRLSVIVAGWFCKELLALVSTTTSNWQACGYGKLGKPSLACHPRERLCICFPNLVESSLVADGTSDAPPQDPWDQHLRRHGEETLLAGYVENTTCIGVDQ